MMMIKIINFLDSLCYLKISSLEKIISLFYRLTPSSYLITITIACCLSLINNHHHDNKNNPLKNEDKKAPKIRLPLYKMDTKSHRHC